MNSISVIIPAYNAADFLASSIQSSLSQTLQASEIIVVDDGSQDETAVIAASFGNKIRYVRLNNGGVSRARNEGAAIASGKWLLFLDADDELLPHALETLLKRATEENAGVAYGMVIERREPPQQARLSGFNYAAGIPPQGAERIFWRNAIITPGSALIKKSLHQRLGGFVTGYEPMEDRDYFIKCALLEPIAFCDAVVLDKKWRPSSHGSQHHKRIYRGQRALRALKIWAQERKLPISWMPDDKKILSSALDEAVWRRQYVILPALLEEAKKMKLFHLKAILLSLLSPKENPDWLQKS